MYTLNVPFQISKYATGSLGGGRLPRAANTLAPPLDLKPRSLGF